MALAFYCGFDSTLCPAIVFFVDLTAFTLFALPSGLKLVASSRCCMPCGVDVAARSLDSVLCTLGFEVLSVLKNIFMYIPLVQI
jgi:hypothetical protein